MPPLHGEIWRELGEPSRNAVTVLRRIVNYRGAECSREVIGHARQGNVIFMAVRHVEKAGVNPSSIYVREPVADAVPTFDSSGRIAATNSYMVSWVEGLVVLLTKGEGGKIWFFPVPESCNLDVRATPVFDVNLCPLHILNMLSRLKVPELVPNEYMLGRARAVEWRRACMEQIEQEQRKTSIYPGDWVYFADPIEFGDGVGFAQTFRYRGGKKLLFELMIPNARRTKHRMQLVDIYEWWRKAFVVIQPGHPAHPYTKDGMLRYTMSPRAILAEKRRRSIIIDE